VPTFAKAYVCRKQRPQPYERFYWISGMPHRVVLNANVTVRVTTLARDDRRASPSFWHPYDSDFSCTSSLRQIFLQERIVTVHEVMRRAIENNMPIMQDQKIRLRIQAPIGNRNHVVLFAVERVRGQRERIL
jgi:hypothetical protein